MDLPSWRLLSTDNALDKLSFTDSDEHPTTAQTSQVWQMDQFQPSGNRPVALEKLTMGDEHLRNWASSPPLSMSESAFTWGFRLLVTFREPMTVPEQNVANADDIFDLESSFDLSYFCIQRETLKAIMTDLGLSEHFLAIIHDLRDESVLYYASNCQHKSEKKWMKYVLRTERSLPSDLALTVCWKENDALVTAFLHGCTPKEATRIGEWLDRAKTALKHPLLPAVILAEIQLERHGRIYRQYYFKYTALFNDIRSKSEHIQTKEASSRESDKLEVAEWLTQIFRMYQKHRNFHRLLESFRRILGSLVEMSDNHPESAEDSNISGRLREISNNYEDLVGQSRIIADGTSLLLTTVWSLISQRDSQLAQRANILSQRIADSSRTIAKASGRDSSAMRALAVITMTFLPSTAVAAISSMPIFDWTKYPYSAYVRQSIWIFCVLSGILTFSVLYIWRFWHLRDIWQREVSHRNQEKHRSTEPNSAPLIYPLVDQFFLQGHDKFWESPGGNTEKI